MSDTNATPPASEPGGPATPPALSPELAAARAHWVGLGHDPARFDAALSGDTAPAATTPVDTGTPTPTAKGGEHGLTDAQVQAARANWIAHGNDPAQFDAAVKADGFEVPEITPEAQAQAEHDAAHGFSRKFEPSDYKINYLEHGGKGMDPVALANVNREATTFLAGLQIDPAVGAAIAERVIDVSQATGRMTPAELSLWKQEQNQIVTRNAGGPEGAQETVRLAALALRSAGSGEFRTILLEKAMNDAWLMQTLANHGRNIEEWRKGPQKPSTPSAT